MKVSIVILTKNGQEYINDCLDTITKQEFEGKVEIVAIDSGSADQTLDILKKYPVRIRSIKAEEFSHSKTRNLGVSLAEGDYVVLLSQDAVPTGKSWLKHLIAPLLADSSVGAAFGRQMPNSHTNPVNSFRIKWLYGSGYSLKDSASEYEFPRKMFSFSDVNAVARRELLLQFPFREDLSFCEDVYLAKQLISSGYKIAYCPDASVSHGHNHSIPVIFSRYFDIAVAYKKIGILEDTKRVENEGIRYISEELRYLASGGHWIWIPYALLSSLAKYSGFKTGCAENFLPFFLKNRISRYWFNNNAKKI